jgi:HlyD family secretion protein
MILMKKSILILLPLLALSACNRTGRSDAYGNFEAVEVTISSESAGKILYLDIEEGRQVKAGDLIGLIDTTDLVLKRLQLVRQKEVIQTRILNMESQIAVQEQQKKNILVDKDRVEKLFGDGAATKKQLDDVNGSYDLVGQQIQATKVQRAGILAEMASVDVQISQVDESLRKCRIISPLDGTVLTKYAEQGEITSFGKPVCKIANLQTLELKVYVSGDQLPGIAIGQKVQVLVDKDKKANRELEGTVSWISDKAEFTPKTIQTKTERVNLVYAVKVQVRNDGLLKIGMPGEVNFMKQK